MKKEKLFTGLKTISFLIVLLFSSVAIGQNVVADTYTGNPQATAPTTREGRWYYDDVSKSFFGWNGTTWLDFGAAASGSGDLWSDPVDSNITFDTDQLYDIGTSSFKPANIYANEFRGSLFGSNSVTNTAEVTQYFVWYDEPDLDPTSFAANRGYMWFNDTDDRIKLNINATTTEELAFTSDLSTAGTDDQTASEVLLVDSGGNYTATDVEQAFIEVLSKDDDALEIATSGSRTNYNPTQQNVEFELIAIDNALGSLVGGSTYTAPENFILSTGVNVLTDANIHNGAASIINVLNVSGTGTAEISNLNATEIDVFNFNVDLDGATLEITNAGTWLSASIGSNTAIRLTDAGAAVTIEETGANTNEFRIYPGEGVTYFIPDSTPPTVTSATVEDANDNELVVLFDEAVNVVDVTGLSFSGDLSGITFTGILSNVENSITFSLSGSVSNGDTGNFVYGGTNTITDTEGNSLASGSTAVTNNVVAGNTYTSANAANTNETTGSDTGFTATNNVTLNGTDATLFTNGTESVEVTVNTPASFQIRFDGAGITNGQTILVEYDIYVQGAGSGNVFCRLNSSQGWDVQQQYNLGDGERDGWVSISQTATATQDTPEIQIQASSSVTGVTAVYIDNVRFTVQ